MTTTDDSAMTLTRDAGRHRYQTATGATRVDSFVDHQETSELVVLTQTPVDPSFEAGGVRSALARTTLDDV